MIVGVFGDGTASPKLITSSLNDTLEAHVTDAPDEPFSLCIGVTKNSPDIYVTIVKWALRNDIDVSYFTPMTSKELQLQLDVALTVFGRHERYMFALVDHVISQGGKIYALLGNTYPSVEVRRALARALDNGLEVRDLAEAGLTYVGVSDNPLTVRSIIMANDLTLAEAGEAADNEDEESMAALVQLAEDYSLDPDEYETWAALAEALNEAMADAPPDEEEGEEEIPPAAKRSGKLETLSREELEGASVPELRALAKQLGVEGWDKNRSAKLIDGIIATQGDGPITEDDETEPPEDADYPPTRRAARGEQVNGELLEGFDFLPRLAAGLRAFADALER